MEFIKCRLNCRIHLISTKKQLHVHEFMHITETNFCKILTGILSKRIVVKLLEKNKIMGENQPEVTKGRGDGEALICSPINSVKIGNGI